MASIVRVTRHLDSDMVHLPEAHEFLGRDVEITVRELESGARNDERYSLRGSVLKYEDPFGPAVPVDDWEATS